MSSATRPLDTDAPPPAIGGLLRLAWQAHIDKLYERVTTSFPDVTRAQFALFRWPGIGDGLRPGEIAKVARLSKQTVNDLLGELERNGYLERQPHPTDRRARIVKLTARGHELERSTHEMSRSLEAAWAESVGEKRFARLRTTLEDMVTRGLPQE